MKALQSFDANDVGVVITCALTFTNFDPTGATAVLVVTSPGGPPQAPRTMALVAGAATYTTVAGDFQPGYYVAEVRVSKAGVVFTSEEFLMVVDP